MAQLSSRSLAEDPAVVLEALEVTSLEWRLPSAVGVAVLEKQVQLSSHHNVSDIMAHSQLSQLPAPFFS